MSCFNFPDNAQNIKEETPRRMTQIQMKMEKSVTNHEKSERTKSFNFDYKGKDGNESFRSVTPQPIPLLSAFCTVDKKNELMMCNNGKKVKKNNEETIFSKKSKFFIILSFLHINSKVKPLSELRGNYSNNYNEKEHILENNINIKVNITVNQQTTSSNINGNISKSNNDNNKKKTFSNIKNLDQKLKNNTIANIPMAIKKILISENQEKNNKKTINNIINDNNNIVVKIKKEEVKNTKMTFSSKNNKNTNNSVLHKNNFQTNSSLKSTEIVNKKEIKEEGFFD